MADVNAIIERFYDKESELYNILVQHSQSVAELAVAICRRHPELKADETLVYEGAMLHDIGIIKTDAPGIHCHGEADYICHGTLGAAMLRQLGAETGEDLEAYARISERHTGAGITVKEIEEQNLPLPKRDLLPETIEEQIVCYADKFFSKSRNLREAKSLEHAEKSLMKHGEEGLERFRQMHEKFRL